MLEINLKDLKSEINIENNFKIKMKNKKKDKDLQISINIRSSIVDKKYKEETIEIIQISKIFPPFTDNTPN